MCVFSHDRLAMGATEALQPLLQPLENFLFARDLPEEGDGRMAYESLCLTGISGY
jgi:hypothetical protein